MAEKIEKTNQKQKSGSVHSGHRLRVKERFFREGLDNFEAHQVLEMLLFFGIPMKDTNEIAHRLLDTFGSVYKVMEASFEDLRRVPGMTDNAATLICFSCQLSRRYWVDRCDMGVILDSSKKLGDFVKYRFMGEKVESVIMVSMDNRGKVLNCTRVSSGSVNSSDANLRMILQQALKDNATMIALAHNHPNGHAYPSTADIITTEDIAKGLLLAEIRLLDHIIVSEDDFVSMADTEHLASIFPAKYPKEETLHKKKQLYTTQ